MGNESTDRRRSELEEDHEDEEGHANYMGQMAMAMGKLGTLEGFIRQLPTRPHDQPITTRPKSTKYFDRLGRQKNLRSNISRERPTDMHITTCDVYRAEFDTLVTLVRIHTIQEFLDKVDAFIKLEETIKKARGASQLEATNYTAYPFLESRMNIDHEREEESTSNASIETNSSSASQDEIEKRDSDDESHVVSQDDLEQIGIDEESPLLPKTSRDKG
uniref:Uncharacterized protein n=1 Tax=Cannabis sativa TaxID=3483 RepID=A0A803P4F5_CANSA